MRIEWVMWIDRGSCYDSLRQMTQGFCFTVFCISPPGISKGFSSRNRQAKIQTCLISHPIVNLAPVPESSPPQCSCPHLEQVVFFGSAQCSHHVRGPQELSLGSLAEQCPACGGADVSSQPRHWCGTTVPVSIASGVNWELVCTQVLQPEVGVGVTLCTEGFHFAEQLSLLSELPCREWPARALRSGCCKPGLLLPTPHRGVPPRCPTEVSCR